jgi:Caenorhabditis protein of unknown function, DUF268
LTGSVRGVGRRGRNAWRRLTGATRRDRRLVAIAEAAASAQEESAAYVGHELRAMRADLDAMDRRIRDVHLRVEVPFVFGALAGLGVGARVLDVGCAESSVAFSLASLGCVVTALDPRGYPLAHPGVRVVEATLAGWERGEGEPSFDAVVFLSSVEHFGLGAYAGSGSAAGADREAVVLARGLVREGGLLVLTVPFGVAAVDGLQRTYGLDELQALVEGWDVREMVFVEQVGLVEWRRLASVPEVVDPDRRYVAMVSATAGTTSPEPR